MNFQFFFFAILIFYLIATLFYLFRLIFDKSLFSVIALRLTLFTALLQTVILAAHFMTYQGPLFRNYLDFFQTSALLLSYIFIFLCFAKKFFMAGPLFVTLIDVLCVLSLTYRHPYVSVPLRGQGYLIFHLSAIFLSLSIFAVGLVSAILFLIAERRLKDKNFQGWSAKLPPLVELDQVHHKAVTAGFVLFTFAIITGAGYSKMSTGHYVGENIKQVLSFALWFFFAILLNFRVRQGWQGHKGVMLSLAGFVGMVLLFFVGFQS